MRNEYNNVLWDHSEAMKMAGALVYDGRDRLQAVFDLTTLTGVGVCLKTHASSVKMKI